MHLKYNIDLYLSEGLPPKAEARLRKHLRICSRCRSYYDRQTAVHRALSGDPDNPTPQEEERLVRLIRQNVGLQPAEQPPEEKPGFWGRVLWTPAPMLATAIFLAILTIGCVAYSLLVASPGDPVIAARLVASRNVELDGVPLDAKASADLSIHTGVKLAVGRGGFAQLSLQQGGSVRVFPGSTLSLSGPGEILELASGKVWCLVDPVHIPFAIPFMVKTDTAEVRSIGTSFAVEILPSGETDVRVAKGVVEVRETRSGDAIRVEGCYETRIAAGNPPSPPGRYSPKHDRLEWNAVVTGGEPQ